MKDLLRNYIEVHHEAIAHQLYLMERNHLTIENTTIYEDIIFWLDWMDEDMSEDEAINLFNELWTEYNNNN